MWTMNCRILGVGKKTSICVKENADRVEDVGYVKVIDTVGREECGKTKAASRKGRLPLKLFFDGKDYSHSIVALGFGDIS